MAAWVFVGAFALPGLGYLWYAAARGDVLGAFTGAGIALGAIGVGASVTCGIRLAAVLDANLRELTELRRRADAVDALLEQISPMVGPSELGANAHAREESDAERDAFPRLVDGEPATVAETADPSETPESLRTEFRRCVYAGDFAGAMVIGEVIMDRYPESEMASQYDELREALSWRSASNGSHAHRADVVEPRLRAGS